MLHRKVFIFIDNDAARHALIRMASSNLRTSALLRDLANLQMRYPAYIWYSRVPSFSNIADAPSRGEFCNLKKRGYVRVSPSFDTSC